VADRVLKAPPKIFAQRRTRAAAIAAALVLLVGAAAATRRALPRRRVTLQTAPPVAPATPATPGALAMRPRDKGRVQSATSPPGGSAAAERSPAAALLAQADAARQADQSQLAVGLYQAVNRQFPNSPEARIAMLAVGDLLLGLGNPADALTAFDAYLVQVPGGPLTEQALIGRGRSLEKLKHMPGERQVWEALLQRFPGSSYAPTAAKRLDELPK
jgi:TolA-binding protein